VKFGCKERGVRTADAEHDKRPGIAQHCRADARKPKIQVILGRCLADEAVSGEPVSEARFPANREKNREFRENRAVWQKAARKNVAKSDC
jgi:hypothetical protein